MTVKFIKNDFQKEICEKAINVLDSKRKVGLEVFTSGGKSIIASEIIEHLRNKGIVNNVLVVAKEGTWCALTSRMQQIGFNTDNVYHVKNSKLSRGASLKDCIAEQGIDSESIDLILFDECHQLFGTNIRQELDKNKEYIYSRYVIAMTATTYTGIKMIDSLKEIVGEENTVKFNLNDAVARDIIDPINIVEVKLDCKSEYYDYINELTAYDGNSLLYNKILKFADSAKRLVDRSNIEDISNVIYQSIIVNAKKHKVKLDATDGARVLVFFNRIDDIRRFKDYIVNAVRKIYGEANINYIEYTSKSSNADNEEAVRLLTSNTATKNTVDVVVTCDVGAESFHPVNIQLGLVFGGTQSIRKAIQRIGRFITLKQYKTSDYIIVDFSESNKINTSTTYTGKNELNHRTRELESYGRYFNDSTSVIEDVLDEYSSSINFEISSIDTSILDVIGRLNALVNIAVNNDDLTEFIDKNIRAIDGTYYGNIAKFLKENEERYPEIKDNDFRKRFDTIRRYMLYPGLTKSDFDILSKSFGKYGVSLYLGENTSNNMTSEIKILYRRIQNGSFNADDYYREFVTRKYPNECIAMIRGRQNALNSIYSRVIRSVPDCYGVPKSSVLYNKLLLINKLCDSHFQNGGLDKVGSELASMLYIYLDTYYAMTQDKKLRNITSTYLMMMRDLGLKVDRISGESKKGVRQVFELDIVRRMTNSVKPEVSIKNKRVENEILRLCCEKVSKIQSQAISICIADKVGDSYEKFIEDGLKLTNAYKIANKAYESMLYVDLKELNDFINCGGYIPKKLMKQFNVDGMCKKYTAMEQVRNKGTDVKDLTSLEYLSIFISSTDVLKDMRSLSIFKSGKLTDTHGNYDKILSRVLVKLSCEDIDNLHKVSKAKVLVDDCFDSVIADLRV